MIRRDLERELIVRVFQASNKLQMFIDRSLKDSELTAKQFYFMIFLGTFKEAPTVSDLSKIIGTSRQNVKQLAVKLETNGYIRIEKDGKDQRVTRMYFTEKSRSFWDDRNDNDDRDIKELYERFSDSDLSTTLDVLTKLLDVIG